MRTPPLLLGAALLFWGWQSELWLFAALMAVVLEGSRVFRNRWEFSQSDYNRLWNLCIALFFGTAIYIIASNEGGGALTDLFNPPGAARTDAVTKTSRSALLMFRWFPFIFFPFVAAQAFSVKDTVPLSTFSWWMRRREKKNPALATTQRGDGVNVSQYYFAACLIAASATNRRELWFYAGFSLLVAWSFWQRRSRRFSTLLWCGLIAVVIALGFVGSVGLNRLQKVLENMDVAWLARFSGLEFDPKESRTSLDSIGRLKLSGQIVLRIDPGGTAPPALLREASYNSFKSPSWYGVKKDWESVSGEDDGTTWILQPEKKSKRSVTISHFLNNGRGLLALPSGVSKLETLPVLLVEHNRMGTVRVSDGPGLVSYRAAYAEGKTIDGPTEDDDLRIPDNEAVALSQIARELDLASKTPAQAITTVTKFFADNFQYSTYLRAPTTSTNQTALAEFLLHRRAGHCEYFATATTLLLREAKIPTRYAAGYSVQEKAGSKYVVRKRHAHAWCLVQVNGVWQDLDTTPPSWSEVENARASIWESLSDAWSRIWFEFSKWRWSQTNLRKYLLWLAVPLILGLAAQLIFKKQWARSKSRGKNQNVANPLPGLDSEFYEIEKKLLERGLDRQPGETLAAWVSRVAPAATNELPLLVSLHYRLRFDPAGLSGKERSELKQGVQLWLGSERTRGD